MAKVKVRVGQVWRANGEHHKIIRLDPYDKVSRMAVGGGHDGKQRECPFGQIDKDDYPLWSTLDCPLVKDAAPVTLLDFFMQTATGYCACNIPIAQCRYHGSSKV